MTVKIETLLIVGAVLVALAYMKVNTRAKGWGEIPDVI